jgi:hypothetical protein
MIDLSNKTGEAAERLAAAMSNIVTGEDYEKKVAEYEEKYYKDNGKVNKKAVRDDLVEWLEN